MSGAAVWCLCRQGIYANLVSVRAYQAPADDKILRGGEEEAVVWEASGKLSGAPVPTTGEELETRAVR